MGCGASKAEAPVQHVAPRKAAPPGADKNGEKLPFSAEQRCEHNYVVQLHSSPGDRHFSY